MVDEYLRIRICSLNGNFGMVVICKFKLNRNFKLFFFFGKWFERVISVRNKLKSLEIVDLMKNIGWILCF